ncbi:lysM and putative peptidoglycan-binding domain-containing protein 3 [Bacillus rossius redtenbacheri]|uniref:lysM and putative peptidoglycan-binding domain-containing protein 3 n=1 Tax=Bacillus rossius redtenbacheri TaxID=93214 RepID=UPI002FDD8EAF
MMKRNSFLSKSHDGQRRSRWDRAQSGGGYSLLATDESSGDGDHLPLESFRQELCLEKQLQPGDTLQSLALQFNCSTAELKRVNRILKENEIFALRVVKIPARCYSLLTERLPGVHTAACSSEGPQDVSTQLHAPGAPARDVQAAGDAPSVTCLDGAPEPEETDASAGGARLNGADWGLSWLALLLCVLGLGFVGPVLYVLYIALAAHRKN